MSLGSHMKPRHGVSSPRSGPQTVDWNDYEWNDINPKRQPVDFQLPPPESQSVLELVRKLRMEPSRGSYFPEPCLLAVPKTSFYWCEGKKHPFHRIKKHSGGIRTVLKQ